MAHLSLFTNSAQFAQNSIEADDRRSDLNSHKIGTITCQLFVLLLERYLSSYLGQMGGQMETPLQPAK